MRLHGAWPALCSVALAWLGAGCDEASGKCDGQKCTPYNCTVFSKDALRRPEAYDMSPEDVMSVVEGRWAGESVTVEVRRRAGEAKYGEPIGYATDPLESAWLDCAQLRVPAEVKVTRSASTDAGTESYDSIVVHGHELAASGTTPEPSTKHVEGQVLGFPKANDLYFGRDGTLWSLPFPQTSPTAVGHKE